MPTPRSIFVVDDDNDFLSLLVEILTQAGYRVESSTNPEAALARVQEESFDLIVLDQKMPILTGADFLTTLRKTHPMLPVVVVSGFLEQSAVQQFINLGVAGVFFKPLNIFSLTKRVEEIFKGSVKSSGSTSAPTDTGLRGFTRTPFGAGLTKEVFLKKIQGLSDFKGNLLLLGDGGSPFEAVASEIVKKFPGDRTIVWKSEFVTPSPLTEALVGTPSATILILETGALTGEEKSVIYKIAKHEAPYETLPAVRFIFCLSQELDSLYEKGLIDDQFYLFLGNLELRLPKAVNPQALHKTDGLVRAAAALAEGTTAPFKGAGRVLVLDDEELHAEMVADLLTEAGFRPLKMTSPAEALLALRKERFSLIITDFRMPGINGVDFIGQTRQIDPSLPVLLVTGNIQVPEMVRVGNMGITKLIQKPIDAKTFIEEVRALLRP